MVETDISNPFTDPNCGHIFFITLAKSLRKLANSLLQTKTPPLPGADEFFTQMFPDSYQSFVSQQTLNMNCRKFVLLIAGVLSIGLAENKETRDQDDDHYKEGDSYFSKRESHPHACRKPGNCEVLYVRHRDVVISAGPVA